MILSLFNESENPSSNNKMIEISIPSINFNKDEYKLLSIFIHQYPNILALTEVNKLDINKKFINLK
jgi:DNA polymerase III delta subunit